MNGVKGDHPVENKNLIFLFCIPLNIYSLGRVLNNTLDILRQLKLLIRLCGHIIKGHLGTIFKDSQLTRMRFVIGADYYDPLEFNIARERDIEQQLLISIALDEFTKVQAVLVGAKDWGKQYGNNFQKKLSTGKSFNILT